MNKHLLLLAALLCLCTAAGTRAERFRVMTWNVENLFDTCHDAGFDDHEFLPDAPRKWNGGRYGRKVDMVARTIAAVGGGSPPELVALCEVENDSVMTRLTRRSLLARLGYDYVMTAGPDARGIDVALLYQPARFRLLSSASLPVSVAGRRLRDVLHVAGLLPTGDTLDVLVCHQPSRAGGGTSHKLRLAAARRLRGWVDSLASVRHTPRLLLMGDFNDDARAASLRNGLRVAGQGRSAGSGTPLVVLSDDLREPDGVRGTYKYRGAWNQLDQIIVSPALLDSTARVHARPEACHVAVFDYLVQPDPTYGGVKPRRTYLGTYYNGGVSDHLPLYVDFELTP